ncbi:MAG: hypothetical protein WDM94_13780 [Bauldia sp.]
MARQSFESAAFDGDDDKPVDPTFLRVQARLRRLMLIGGLTLGLGIIAVFAAILYRIATYDTTGKAVAPDAAVPTLSLSAMGLPADAKLVSTALDGNRMALTYEAGGGDTIVVIDLRTGAVVARTAIGR